HELVQGLDRIFLTSDKAMVGGALVTLQPSFVPTELLSTPSQQPVAIEPTAWRPGAASYRTSAVAPSLLVEVDAFAPGWRVFVDGHEQPILQANVFGRAVVVPAGSHSVEWRFAPRLVIAGMFASWVGLARPAPVFPSILKQRPSDNARSRRRHIGLHRSQNTPVSDALDHDGIRVHVRALQLLRQQIAAVCADLPHKRVRKSGMPNIIEGLVGQVSHGG